MRKVIIMKLQLLIRQLDFLFHFACMNIINILAVVIWMKIVPQSGLEQMKCSFH